MGAVYLRICCCFSIGLFMQIGMERMMTAQGKTIYAMVIQMVAR